MIAGQAFGSKSPFSFDSLALRLRNVGALVFALVSANGYRSLDEGARVSFVAKKGPKGLQAEDVSLA